MKQKDLAIVGAVILFSVVISLVLSNMIIAPPKNKSQEVEQVQPIVSTFPEPDKRFFNDKAFDPTRIISIGDSNNPDPFTGGQ